MEKIISDFNISIIRSFITDGGVINKQNFWKLKKAIAPCSKETPCALLSKQDILLTDPAAIRNEYYSEFKHRLTLFWMGSGRTLYWMGGGQKSPPC